MLRVCRRHLYVESLINIAAQMLLLVNHSQKLVLKCKRIFIKMLKDVGIAVTKTRETRAVYVSYGIQQ